MLKAHHLDPVSECIADRLSDDPNYRVLRALPQPYFAMTGEGGPPEGRCIALVDLETTGLNPETGAIIELAIKLLWVADDGELLGHFPIYSWLEDPGFPLDPQISRLTGLRDADLSGKKIDNEAVARLLDRSDLIVAHNAAFDAAWIEQRWPRLAGRAWACSCAEIDWLGLGFDGRSQQYLLQQHGWFSRAHRAVGDVWSLFWLLLQSWPGREGQDAFVHIGADECTARPTPTHLQRLLAASARPSIKIEAIGIPFSRKALLGQRGYRWDPGSKRRYWWRELDPKEVEAEQEWFTRHGFPEPRCVPIGAHERHR